MKRQAGFTMIELVMVIVILGILAAFALPRFADLGQEARLASLNGAIGAVRSASAIAHAQALVRNTTNGDITIEGATISQVNAYPDAETIASAAQLGAEFNPTNNGTVTTVTQGNCSFTYTEAAANSAPTISAITGGPNC